MKWSRTRVDRPLDLAGAGLLGVLLCPQAAWAGASPELIGGGVAVGGALLLGLGWVLIRRSRDAGVSPPETALSRQVVEPATALVPVAARDARRIERLRLGLERRRADLRAGGEGFVGDAEVMTRYLQGCDRVARGAPPPAPPRPDVPPGTLSRLLSLYEQLSKASPQRARDWSLQRGDVSASIKAALGQGLSLRCLAHFDRLAERRAAKERPSSAEAEDWTELIGWLAGTEPPQADLGAPVARASSGLPESEAEHDAATVAALATPPSRSGGVEVDQDVPTWDARVEDGAEVPLAEGEDEDAPTMDTDALFPEGEEEDAPTTDTDALFPEGEEEDAPTMDTDALFPEGEEEDAPTMDTDALFPEGEEEDAPTMDTDALFPEGEDEDAPTMDTAALFPSSQSEVLKGQRPAGEVQPIVEGDEPPTLDTDALFASERARKSPPSEEPPPPAIDAQHLFRGEPDENEEPTIDTHTLFKSDRASAKAPRLRGGGRRRDKKGRPAIEAFTEDLLDPVEDAPTRDTADLFRDVADPTLGNPQT